MLTRGWLRSSDLRRRSWWSRAPTSRTPSPALKRPECQTTSCVRSSVKAMQNQRLFKPKDGLLLCQVFMSINKTVIQNLINFFILIKTAVVKNGCYNYPQVLIWWPLLRLAPVKLLDTFSRPSSTSTTNLTWSEEMGPLSLSWPPPESWPNRFKRSRLISEDLPRSRTLASSEVLQKVLK